MKIEYLLVVLLALGALSFFGRSALFYEEEARDKKTRYENSVLAVKSAVAGQ